MLLTNSAFSGSRHGVSPRACRPCLARKAATAAVCVLVCLGASALDISNRYRSPRNPERRVRTSTRLIVLHTTEAPARSSLNKVSDRGECHYCVTESGQAYRIVDRDREAFHAGRSMWQGVEDVDKFSIGIECVGYHDKAMPAAQIAAIRELVEKLKSMYRIPDQCVVCHSHVAYGAPNKWHKFKHRGRKRCGMLFAMQSVRRRLGLMKRPAFDPDTRAQRLKQADEYLRRVLYGNTDTMAQFYGNVMSLVAPRPSVAVGGKPPASAGAPQRKATVAVKPVHVVAKPPATTKLPATPKVPPVLTAAMPTGAAPKTIEQLKARGYTVAGTVSRGVTASKIAGRRWKSPDTYYTIRDKVIPGSQIDDSRIERGMRVWMKK